MKKEYSVSTTNGKFIRHIGVYYDKKTADRIKANITYFAGKGFKVIVDTK